MNLLTRSPFLLPLWAVSIVVVTSATAVAAVDPCQALLERTDFGSPDSSGITILFDIDEDGDLDILVSRRFLFGPNTTRVILNNGDETFTDSVVFPTFVATSVGDVDGDGRADLVGTIGDQAASGVARGQAGGSFAAPEVIEATPFFESVLFDVDGDGDLDLATTRESAFFMYLNDSTGNFTMSDGAVLMGQVRNLVAGDLNDDGTPDVAVSESVGYQGISRIFLASDGTIGSIDSIETGPTVAWLQVADLDGIAPLDYVVARYQGDHIVLLGDGTQLVVDGVAGALGVLLSDFDADGELDMVINIASGVGETHVHFGLGGGNFGPPITVNDTGGYFLVEGDMNDDGVIDYATLEAVLWNRTFDFEDCNLNGIPDRCDILTEDCNANGIPDSCDLTSGAENDLNFDGIPDSCQQFRRGDSNSDGAVNLSDGIFVLTQLFMGPVSVDCEDASDFNDDGLVDLGDAVGVLSFLFTAGSPPPPPPTTDCGIDPTTDMLACATSQPCP